ncbi:hypothetical protein CQW23_09428 [Capsicum baccatum]|uniref:Uncharacterized protein n=1 Tax=Capsicum baccatum TaxID=33114 RepID=A0A2G2WWW0_CAPBA|nr:hypothetical protein CQW23_09428 [Capsicum baccatum]
MNCHKYGGKNVKYILRDNYVFSHFNAVLQFGGETLGHCWENESGGLGDIDCLGAIDQISVIGRQLGRHGLLGRHGPNKRYRLLNRLRLRGRHRPMCHLGAFGGMCILGFVGDIGCLGAIGSMGRIGRLPNEQHGSLGSDRWVGFHGPNEHLGPMYRLGAFDDMGHFAIMVDLCLFDAVDGVGCLGTVSGMGCLVGRMIIIGCMGHLDKIGRLISMIHIRGMGRLASMSQLGGMGRFGALCGIGA